MLNLLKLLGKVPFLGTAISFVTGNVRLVIEYLLIAVAIAGAATALTLWYRTNYLESRNDELRERITNVEVINETQDQTITDLQNLRKIDAEVMAGLVTDYAKLSKSDAAARKKLSDLEKQNERVRDYLDEPLPAELVCMLNNSCTETTKAGGADRKGAATEQPAGAVQKARPASGAK